MAVYTYLNEAQLRMIGEYYGFAEIEQAIPIAEGVENSNYLLHYKDKEQAGQKAILTVFEKRVNQEDIPFYLTLKQHLHRHAIPCPLPYQTVDGQLFMPFGDKALAIVGFLEGKSIYHPKRRHIIQAARILAEMHLAAKDFTLIRKNAMSFEGWKTLLKRIQAAQKNDMEEAQYQLAAEEYTFQCRYFPHDLPKGIIHADLFPNNVFFDASERLSGMIDFYFACKDALAYDLAIVANAWCFEDNGHFNTENYRALVAAYDGIRPLEKTEKDAMPVLLRAAAMRFLLTRLHDVLYHDKDALVIPHNPQEYADKLKFHQQNIISLI